MHRREFRERRIQRHQQSTERLFGSASPQVVECDRVSNRKLANSRATQLGQMCADGQKLSKILSQRSHVRSRRTDNTRVKVEGAIPIIFEQSTVRFDSSELMNANTN